MTDAVVDASALVLAVAGRSPAATDLRSQLADGHCHAPHLIDAEVGHVLRRHVHAGLLSAREASIGRRLAEVLIDQRHPHRGAIGEAAWDLRDNLTYYDALYVALASRLGLPLLTGDARLARAPALPCPVEVV